MKKAIIIGLLCSVPFAAMAEAQGTPEQERAAKSKAVVHEFAGKLKGELKSALKNGGPLNAIQVCNNVAPSIAKELSSKYGWEIARTSLKTRNSNNAPDAWETKVLNDFEQRKANGEKVKEIAYSEVVEENGTKVFRFMKAIPTSKECLQCHGEKIDPQVAAKLDELYPNDQARGYKKGDLRGAFTIKQPM